MNSEFQKVIEYRRSNRSFDPNVNVPDEVIKGSLERAILSPNSSNMQLWEFYWLSSEKAIKEYIPLCLNQQAARTAKQMVVFVTRKDKWRERAKWNLDRIKETIHGEPSKLQKGGLNYYGKIMPLLYKNDIFGFFSLVRRSISFFMGLRKPFFRTGGTANQRIMAHKSCALAAQTFMLSIAAEGFHSCPMEGFDEKRVKRALNLPRGAEINMIISVGLGTEEGIWGDRFRVPYEEVVFKL
ncbi:MAG: nitroreductase family protein [Cryomorphaceae bacterium]|jgi:nitroreductase|nr:nitroreductase family protein [Cryomorphaceae bacterium]